MTRQFKKNKPDLQAILSIFSICFAKYAACQLQIPVLKAPNTLIIQDPVVIFVSIRILQPAIDQQIHPLPVHDPALRQQLQEHVAAELVRAFRGSLLAFPSTDGAAMPAVSILFRGPTRRSSLVRPAKRTKPTAMRSPSRTDSPQSSRRTTRASCKSRNEPTTSWKR